MHVSAICRHEVSVLRITWKEIKTSRITKVEKLKLFETSDQISPIPLYQQN